MKVYIRRFEGFKGNVPYWYISNNETGVSILPEDRCYLRKNGEWSSLTGAKDAQDNGRFATSEEAEAFAKEHGHDPVLDQA